MCRMKSTQPISFVFGLCGKCHKIQEMERREVGKEVTYYCPNCDDQISPSICDCSQIHPSVSGDKNG